MPYPLTDLGNAERMASQHEKRLRYCEDRDEWRVWTGSKWQRDAEPAAVKLAIQTVRTIAAEGDSKEVRRWAERSEASKSISAMVNLARRCEPLPVEATKFDRDPWLLNTPSCVVDLRDGSLRDHKPEDLLTRQTVAPFEPFASSTVFDEFLAWVVNGDEELSHWLQKAVGMSLIGTQLEHVVLFLSGGGGNGKGTLLNAICYALGDYAVTLPENMLMDRMNDAHPTELTDLEGARIAIGSEVPEGGKWNEVRLKGLSGGDPIRARRMRGDFYQFDASHTFWISGNHRPRIRGTDDGIWRRMRLVPFTAKIDPDKKDNDLPNKLQIAAPAILYWAVQGCLNYLREGLGLCEAVRQATEQYRQDEDIFGAFMEDELALGSHLSCDKGEFRDLLTAWLLKRGYKPMSDRAIKSELAKRNIEETRPGYNQARQWSGCKPMSKLTIYEREALRTNR